MSTPLLAYGYERMESRMNIGVYQGDICRAPAEVVCTSTNPHLELMLGTGGAIREAGGWSIQQECKAIIAEEKQRNDRVWLPVGSAVRTSAGALPFRCVIHCVAIDAFHDSSIECIRDCTRNALRQASELSPPVQSIAFPVFASGNGLFDFEQSLNAMLEELKTAARADLRIWIVVYEPWRVETARKIVTAHFGACDEQG